MRGRRDWKRKEKEGGNEGTRTKGKGREWMGGKV